MKTREHIQRRWDLDWFTPLADLQALSFSERTNIKKDLRAEIFWVVTSSNFDLEAAMVIRANKIQTLMDANDGTAASFDPIYMYRKQFFEWCLL
jgi:hypothetical protein